METTTSSSENLSRRARGSGRGGANEAGLENYDLLTAAVLGAVVGGGLVFLLRSAPRRRSTRRVIGDVAERGARLAEKYGAKGARLINTNGAKRWARRKDRLVDRLPLDALGEQLGDYLASAREVIDDTVSSELKDLRKAIRRQRKRLGV